MKNSYEICGEFTNIFAHYKGEPHKIVIDTKDFDLVSGRKESWYLVFSKDLNSFYARCSITENGKRKPLAMHRWIMNPQPNYLIDHINHITLDNRRSNLKITTNSENQQNRKGATRNSKSGIRGVCWHKATGKWMASYQVNKKLVNLGLFVNVCDAESAVKNARLLNMTNSIENYEIGG